MACAERESAAVTWAVTWAQAGTRTARGHICYVYIVGESAAWAPGGAGCTERGWTEGVGSGDIGQGDGLGETVSDM